MANKRDYYEVLGVSKDASPDEIKRAYRKLAKEYHPDVSTDPNATEKFAEIQVAYDCLSDPAKKENYDRFGTEDMNGFQGAGGGAYGAEGFGFEDIFSSFFGGGRRTQTQNAKKQGRDIYQEVTITFEEAATVSPKDLLLGNWRNISSNTRRDLRFLDNDTAIYGERLHGGTVPEMVEDYGPWKYRVSEDSIAFLSEPVYPFNLVKDTFQYSTTYSIIDSILILSTFSKDGKQFVHDIEFIKEQ